MYYSDGPYMCGSYAARKENEKNLQIKENTQQLREFTIIYNKYKNL